MEILSVEAMTLEQKWIDDTKKTLQKFSNQSETATMTVEELSEKDWAWTASSNAGAWNASGRAASLLEAQWCAEQCTKRLLE